MLTKRDNSIGYNYDILTLVNIQRYEQLGMDGGG